jgi:serine/threonine protein kinase
LGGGAFSEVWQAEDRRTGLIIALKVYAPGTGLDTDGVKLFSAEFSLVFNFNHSNLLRPSHCDIGERMPYLVMQFCERGSAKKLIGKISEEEAWKFLHDVATGLAYLHEQNPPVIHQDIKPDNVLISNDGKYLITDFGVSTKARNTLRKSVISHSSGGSIPYMGPERFSKENTPIMASDIWSLGATLYELMTGDTPFVDHGGLIQKSGAEIPDIKEHYSSKLKKVVISCLQPHPWDRPTAKQLMGGEQILIPKPKSVTPWKTIIRISIVIVVVIAVFAGGIYLSNGKIEDPDPDRIEEFKAFCVKGDALFQSKNYRDSKLMYDSAILIMEKDGISSEIPVYDRREEVINKIDSLYDDIIGKARRLGSRNDLISVQQAIENVREAMKLKDEDPAIHVYLNQLQSKLVSLENEGINQ